MAEIHLPNITSFDELVDVSKLLYRVNKHSLTLPCHNKETEEVVHKNMRMGIGVTGYAISTKEQQDWLSGCYEVLRKYDEEYSKEKGFSPSIKLTTVKPSGTLSLLSGVSSGAHPAYARYYIRRMRIAASSPLVDVCRQSGYNVEYVRNFDGSEDHNTVVVEFPCSFPEGSVFAGDVTAIDQLETIKKLQTEWSDNAVSVTIYYKKEELPEIRAWLADNYSEGLKSVSFLLHSDHGFDQAPLEEIDEDTYNKMKENTTPITGVSFNEDDISGDQVGCESGICPIK